MHQTGLECWLRHHQDHLRVDCTFAKIFQEEIGLALGTEDDEEIELPEIEIAFAFRGVVVLHQGFYLRNDLWLAVVVAPALLFFIF